jgi:hypothetical protein
MATRAELRLGGPSQLATTTGALITVPAAHTYVVKQIVVCNTDTIDRAFSLAIGSAATTSNRLFSTMPIGANDTLVFDTAIVLAATETLQGLADTNGKITVTAFGWDKY